MACHPDKVAPAPFTRSFTLRLVAGLLILAVCSIWFVLRSPGYDAEQLPQALQEIRQPCHWVKASYFFDGGSIGLEVEDAEGRTHKLALPVDNRADTRSYPKIILGAVHTSKAQGRELELPSTENSRRFLSHLIEHYAPEGFDRSFCLVYLRGAPRDHLTIWLLEKDLISFD